jgi:hypothetical protein
MDSTPHHVWAPWNHPDTAAFNAYLIGSKMLEDDMAVRGAMLDALPALVSPASFLLPQSGPDQLIALQQYHHMVFTIPQEPLPLEFQSFLAAINNIFYFLDVVLQSWTRFLFKPSDENVDKVCTLNLVVVWPH